MRMFAIELWKMIKDPYQNNPVRILIEIVLLGVILRYAFQKKKSSQTVILSCEEAEQLIDEWEPKDLGIDESDYIEYSYHKHILSSFNPFLFSEPPALTEKPNKSLPVETEEEKEKKLHILSDTIDKYGVGTCGPRGFYGTIDIHLELEKKLAESLGVKGSVLYAHSLLAIASVIKCFCKRDDAIFYDHRSSVSIRRGIYASKAKAIEYTSTSDLNIKLALESPSNNKKFIITEGIFEETGETADIAAIVKARTQHKAFLILDESVSIPMLGSTGAVGFFGANPNQIDLRIGSLSTGFGSAGGFCAGSKEVSDLQRLSSLAYCFSASLPAYLAQAALISLESVIRWEKSQFSLYQKSGSESSSEEYQYTPVIEHSARRSNKSPKFLSNLSRDRNSLINYPAAQAFHNEFNSSIRPLPFRAKIDYFTPIVRIILHEDHPEAAKVFSDIHSAFMKEGIFVRLSEYPVPAFLLVFHNAFEQKDVPDLTQDILAIIRKTYSDTF